MLYRRPEINLSYHTDTIDRRGLDPVKSIVKKAGIWPFLDNKWTSRKWSFQEAEHKLIDALHGYGVLIVVTVTEDVVNSDKRLIMVNRLARICGY